VIMGSKNARASKVQPWRWSRLIAIGLSIVALAYLYVLYQYAAASPAALSSSEGTQRSLVKSSKESEGADLQSLVQAQQQELEKLRQALLLQHQDLQQERMRQHQDLQAERQQRELLAAQEALVQQQKRTLRFIVCNGFGNQRLAILYAAILAKETNRALVLPQLIGEGTQRSFGENRGSEGGFVDFGAVYDVDTFKRAGALLGVRVLTGEEAPPLSEYKPVRLRSFQTNAAFLLERENGGDQHISIDCALFKLFPLDPSHEEFAWGILEGLQPSMGVLAIINSAAKALDGSGRSGVKGAHVAGAEQPWAFNVLHLRFEDDWVAHCRRWEAIRDGVIRNNCYNNTETVGEFMELVGVSKAVPLYVAAHWPDVDPQRNTTVMAHLQASGYKVVTSLALLPEMADILGHEITMPRDVMACVDFSLALLASKFVGNSVSTFSALALLERRHHGRWAIYYNDGNIPLTFPLPILHKMPWVFTYNSWSPLYDDMLKVAVVSALNHGGFIGYCLFLGDPQSGIYRWLENHGIVMIHHEPKWKAKLVKAARSALSRNLGYSHLYANPDMLVSTFQRMDLPLVEEISQYNYVLFTDADVYFRRSITLDDFGLPLPESLSMGYELRAGMYPLNAGVMLMHVPYMKKTYDNFLQFVLSNKEGMHFGVHGPVDQGAYNEYYQPKENSRELHQRFNAKVYNTFQREGAIVHFHGPKPREFLIFVEQGTCGQFFWLCEYGWLGSLCDYWPDWHSVYTQVKAEDEQSGMVSSTAEDTLRMTTRLMDACSWIKQANPPPVWTGTEQVTPTLRDLHMKKWGSGVYKSSFVDAS